MNEIHAASGARGIHVQRIEVSDGKSIERAFAAIAKDAPDALAMCWDSVTLEHAPDIADVAETAIAVGGAASGVREGGRATFLRHEPSGPSPPRRVLRRQDLQGSEAGGPAGRAPTLFELVVNLATAKAIRHYVFRP